jgi:hypothetical protein
MNKTMNNSLENTQYKLKTLYNPSSELNSLSVPKLRNISLKDYRFLTDTCFEIPESYRDLYNMYFLLYWKGSYLKERNKEGILTYDFSIPYRIIFTNITPEEAYKASQIKLSFRYPVLESKILPAVLVARANQRRVIQREGT